MMICLTRWHENAHVISEDGVREPALLVFRR